jgi:hypothetical protein
MAFNYSTAGNARRITLGTGVLQMRTFDGITPSSADLVGFSRGAQLSITRQKVEVEQGVPKGLIKQLVVKEDVNFSFTGIEWDLLRVQDGLGTGVLTGSGNDVTLGFGGDMALEELALTFIHQTPTGGTITLDIWRAQGTGEIQITFGDEVHEFPYNFKALVQTTSWGGETLNPKATLFRLRAQIA